MISIVFIPHYL